MNDYDSTSYDGGGSSVQDRKKFFENRINEQKQREDALTSQSSSNCTSRTTIFSSLEESRRGLDYLEERTDSESLFHNISDRTEPDASFGTFGTFLTKSGSDSESDVDPSVLLEQESLYYASKENMEDPANNTWRDDEPQSQDPIIGNTVGLRNSHVGKVKSADEKILPFSNEENEEEPGFIKSAQNKKAGPNHNVDPTSACQNMNTFDEFDNWLDSHDMITGSEENKKKTEEESEVYSETKRSSRESHKSDSETVGTKSERDRTIVKIQVTSSEAENTYPTKTDRSEEINHFTLEPQKNIDDMITEFQQVSSQLSEEFFPNSSPSHSLLDDHSDGESNQSNNRAHIISNESMVYQANSMDETISCDSLLALNAVSINDIEELTERHDETLSKDAFVNNDYICPSESTDDSIDSTGNSKTTKSISSKSAKSLRSLINLKRTSNGMGKILKRATKGMGKSVKNLKVKSASQITQISSVVKKTMKTKPPKESSATDQQPLVKNDEMSDQYNRKEFYDFFNEQLAEQLISNHKGISRASEYLVTGRRLLNNGAQLKKNNDPEGSEGLTRKAHTYAFVGRQLARQYLLEHHEKIYGETVMTSNDLASAVNDDGISAFEDFFLSFLQCVGPCNGDDDMSTSIQVDETLAILSKISEEETNAIDNMLPKEFNRGTKNDSKEKIRARITDAVQKNNSSDKNGEFDSAYGRNLALRRFRYDLQSFYQVDTCLKLSPVVFIGNASFEDTKQESSKPNEKQQRRTEQGKVEDDSGLPEDLSESTSKSVMNESVSYNYSESLKFEDGRNSFHTRSFSTTGSTRKEKTSLKAQRNLRPKEESLAEGIRPGTTVLSISFKKKGSKKNTTNTSNSNKKKKSSTRKWFATGARKQKQ